jgi:hypothetical protein
VPKPLEGKLRASVAGQIARLAIIEEQLWLEESAYGLLSKR